MNVRKPGNHHVTCYPANLQKPKALEICRAFAQGVIACGGTAKVCDTIPERLEAGAAMFYGVRPQVAHLWEQAKRENRDYYYADNSYFDSCRERYFRISRNCIQHAGMQRFSDGARMSALGIVIKPWRSGGEYALVCAQSSEFMDVVAQDHLWLDRTLEKLRRSGEPYVLRTKGLNRPFSFDLENASRVITWSSAAAVMALLNGVPVECSPQCAAYGVTDRQKWAECLADAQWTLAEIERGDAWRALA